MEVLDPPGPGALPPKPGEEDGAPKKGPGRPPADPTKRAINDMRYAQMVEMVDTLPDAAKQPRYGIFRASRRTETKKGFRPLFRILIGEWQEKNLQDESTLRAFLEDKAGKGCYFIEPQDEHNVRMTKVASWCIHTNPEAHMGYDPEDDDEDDFDDDDRPRGRRFRRRYRDDVADDDFIAERADVADVLSTATRASSAQALAANQSKDNLVGLLLLTQQNAASANSANDQRREERLAEERKQEREERDRRDRDAKEERDRRERMEKEDRERKERDDRERRDHEREERRREDDRRREQDAARAAAEAKRTEVMMTAITGLVPLVLKLMEKPAPVQPQSDPVTMMLLKSIVDRTDRADSTQVMFQQMGEMAKLQTTMTSEQMRSMMSLSSDMNQTIMKKALDMMMASPQGGTAEGKGWIEQLMTAMQGAAELVKTLAPAPPAPTIVNQQVPALPAPQQQDPNRRFARQHPPQQQAAPQGQQPAAAQQAAPQAEQEQQPPLGVQGVLYGLMGIQRKSYNTPEEYQTYIQYIFSQIPLALRVAVLDGDELALFRLTKPIIDADPTLTAWVKADGVLGWMRSFIPTLKPTIEQVFGPADQQKQQYAYFASQGEQGMALALATPADFEAYVRQAQAQQQQPPATPTGEQPPEAPAPVPTPDAPAPAAGGAEIQPEAPPVTVTTAEVPAEPQSHLERPPHPDDP